MMVCRSDAHLKMRRFLAHFTTLDIFEKLGVTAPHVILQVIAQASHWQPRHAAWPPRHSEACRINAALHDLGSLRTSTSDKHTPRGYRICPTHWHLLNHVAAPHAARGQMRLVRFLSLPHCRLMPYAMLEPLVRCRRAGFYLGAPVPQKCGFALEDMLAVD